LEKRGLIYEGKAKCLYATDREDYLVQEFKDELPDGEGGRKNPVPGKGESNNGISSFLFQYLESYHVPTHFVERYGPTEMLVRKLAMIPIEVEVYNIASVKLAKTFALVEGSQLDYPILEYYLKSDPLGDPMINEYHALALGYAQPDEMRTVGRLASKINAILKSFFERRGLMLASFKIEFGKQSNQIYVGDEISLDSCCFWDRKTNRRVDFERARHDPVVIEKMYRDFYDRLTNSS
jgi:phosphoribosylaminoimidazole-succinocarboxamide synthase